MPKLALVRHGQSAWNLENRFTGWWDADLTEKGEAEARKAGQLLKGVDADFRAAFTSVQTRAIRTLWLALTEMGRAWIPVEKAWQLNERHYGGLTGLNKAETAERHGEEQVHVWRRSYDTPPPGGESLRDTGARVWPYYIQEILPQVMRGKRVLVAAHGNSLRAMVMVLDGLSRETIPGLNLDTGVPMVYHLNADTTVASKEILSH